MLLETHNFEFDEFLLDTQEKVLLRDGKPLPITPKAFHLLFVLLEKHGHLVEKDELMKSVWADSFVEEGNITFTIGLLRKLLEDDTKNPRFIETVPRRGYRFIAKVQIIKAENEKSDIANEVSAPQLNSNRAAPAVVPHPAGQNATQHSGTVVALSDWRREADESKAEKSAPVFAPETTNGQIAKLELVPATAHVKNRRKNYPYLLAGLSSVVVLLIFAVSLNSWFTQSKSLEADAPVLSASFSSEKLSTNGKVVHAVVSPDGKNVIYTNGIKGKQSIWLRQLESANIVEIIPPSDNVYGRLAFAPEGNSFYFTRKPRNEEGHSDIYRISIFGGIPTKIVSEAQSSISISPDGGKVSFVRCYLLEDENCSLWIADTDGSNERKLVSRPRPFRIGNNKISPNGKTVAFAVGQSKNAANEFGLVEVNIENGTERELTTQKFFNIKTLEWLPSQSGLLIVASRIPTRNFRLWQVSVATDDASPLTKDSENYSALSLDKAADVIVATQTKTDFKLFLYNRENPSEKRILADATTGGFAPNGKIIFASLMSGNREIWSINVDGSEERQLTNNPADESAPVSSPDNRFVFFVSNRTGEAQVWRMNADGSNQMQITFKEGGFPAFVSPDGRWVYYHHGVHRTLWRVSTTPSGEEEQLVLNKEKYRFAFSPDGSRVAFAESQGQEKSIAIVSLADGRTIRIIKYADRQAGMTELDWLPDGNGLAYILVNNESDNHTLWLQSLDAETPQKIADLGDEHINSLALSPDGKSFAIVQGSWKHDAVLLKGLK